VHGIRHPRDHTTIHLRNLGIRTLLPVCGGTRRAHRKHVHVVHVAEPDGTRPPLSKITAQRPKHARYTSSRRILEDAYAGDPIAALLQLRPALSSSTQRVWLKSIDGASLASAAVLPNAEPYVYRIDADD